MSDLNNQSTPLSAAAVLLKAEKIPGRKPPYEMPDFAPVARVPADEISSRPKNAGCIRIYTQSEIP
jgi:hypothetical protein